MMLPPLMEERCLLAVVSAMETEHFTFLSGFYLWKRREGGRKEEMVLLFKSEKESCVVLEVRTLEV